MSACGGGGSGPEAAPEPEIAPQSLWQAVDETTAAAFSSASDVEGMTLSLYDKNDVKVFEKTYGTFDADRPIAVASASKIVSAMLILRLIDQGLLTLDSTTAERGARDDSTAIFALIYIRA